MRDSHKIKGLLKHLLMCNCGAEIRPNYTKKKNGTVYYYYRCASTMNPAKKGNCGHKYLNMDATNELVFQQLLQCANESYLVAMKAKVVTHNKMIQAQIDVSETEIEGKRSSNHRVPLEGKKSYRCGP